MRGNSSQISDGAAALLFMSAEKARSVGLRPIARVHTAVVAAADQVIMLTAPIPSTQRALKRSRLTVKDIGVFEVNEAFAPVPLACSRRSVPMRRSSTPTAERSHWVTRSEDRVPAS